MIAGSGIRGEPETSHCILEGQYSWLEGVLETTGVCQRLLLQVICLLMLIR